MSNLISRSWLVIILFFHLGAFSALNGQALPEGEREDIMNRAKVILQSFTESITIIGDKEVKDILRTSYIDDAVKLFREDAIMEVSSAYRADVEKYGIREYLIRLMNLPYDNVKIDFAIDALYLDIDSFEKDPDSETYRGQASILQKFCGTYNQSGDVKFDYCGETTKKTVEVIVSRIRIHDGVRWRILLGDVTVQETHLN